jgi:hypothetical protein
MKTIRSIAAGNSHRLPARLKLISTRLGSLILLFQRMPVVQFLFPEANIIGGASVANTISIAVTTVVGLGVLDSVAGVSPPTITQNLPLANSTTVPAAVGSPLNFKVTCAADSYPKSWKSTPALPLTPATATSGALTGLGITYTLSPPSNNWVNYITGIPTVAGTSTVTISANRYTNNTGTGDNVVSQAFNIAVDTAIITTHPSSTSISNGDTARLEVVGAIGTGTGLTYQWYQGDSPSITTPISGANSAVFTTPSLSANTNYWVKVTRNGIVTGKAYSVVAYSNTATVTVTAVSPYDDWAKDLSAEKRGPGMMPQNDGVTNLEKFAFNLNPLAPDVRRLTAGAGALAESAGLPVGARVGGVLRIEFLRRKAGNNPGITYKPQFSSSLGGWVDFTGTESVSPAADSSWERVTVDDTVGGSARFGRVKVTQTP